MRGALVVATWALAACTHRSPVATCGAGWVGLSERRGVTDALVEPRTDTTIRSIAVRGVAPEVAATLRSAVQTRPGQRVSEAPLADDVRRLWALGVIADARVELAGDALEFVVTSRPRIGRVVTPRVDPVALRRFELLAGARFDPARLHRIANATERSYAREGYLDARVALAMARRADAVDVCIAATPGPRVTIAKLELAGRRQVPEAVLRAAIHGAAAGINVPGGVYDEEALVANTPALLDAYYERGMMLAAIGAPRVTRRGHTLHVTLPITEGPVFRFGALGVEGMPHVTLPFSRDEIITRSRIAQLRAALEELAGTTIDVRTSFDRDANRIDLTFIAQRRWPWDVFMSLPSRSP